MEKCRCIIISVVSYHQCKKEKNVFVYICIKCLWIHTKNGNIIFFQEQLEVRGVRETYSIVYLFVSLEFCTMYMTVLVIKSISPKKKSQIKVSFIFSSIWKFGIILLQTHLRDSLLHKKGHSLSLSSPLCLTYCLTESRDSKILVGNINKGLKGI